MRINGGARVVALDEIGSELPSEFRLFSLGVNQTKKGDFTLDAEGLSSIIAAYKDQGVDLAIDYEHQTFSANDNGKPAPAAGWFEPQAREDGLWATNVRWTDAAAEMLRKKEYRYFSPTFEVDDENRITRLLPLALTNLPATKNISALVAATEREEKMNKGLVNVIGLKEDADEVQVEGRIMALVQNEKQLLDITGKPTAAEALGVLIALKDAGAELEKARKALREWEAKDDREKQDLAKKQIAALVDGAIVDGRVSLKD